MTTPARRALAARLIRQARKLLEIAAEETAAEAASYTRHALSLVQIQLYKDGQPERKMDAEQFRKEYGFDSNTFLLEAVRQFNAQQKAEGTGLSAKALQHTGKPVGATE